MQRSVPAYSKCWQLLSCVHNTSHWHSNTYHSHRLLQTNRSLFTERGIVSYTLKKWVVPTDYVWCQT